MVDGCVAGTPSGDYKRDTRRKAALEPFERAEPRSPTVTIGYLSVFSPHFFRPAIEILEFSDPNIKF